MPKRLLDSTLLTKLSTKVRKSEKYIREQISLRASHEGISSQAYFVKWLNEEKIPCAIYQRSLSDSVKNEIRAKPPQNTSAKIGNSRAQKIQRTERIFKIKELNIQENPPILPNNLIKEAHNNTEVYQALYIFENSVRNFIASVLKKNYGDDWWSVNRVVNDDIRNRVQTRMQEEKINPFHGNRGVHEIFYTDFSELSSIIQNNAISFNPFFKGMKGKTSFLTRRLDELAMSRNAIAHMSPLKRGDRDRFLLYFKDWYNQLTVIKIG